MGLVAPKPEEWRIQQAITMRKSDAQVVKLLKQLQFDVNKQLYEVLARPAGLGRSLRESQLRLIKGNLNRELAKVWRELGDITQALRLEAATRSLKLTQQADTFLLAASGLAGGAEIARAIADAEIDAARSGLDRMIARTSGASYVPLSERVYNSSVAIQERVDTLVNSALARGLSAVEFAKQVREFVNPASPGGARYAALRLSRTEINNASHAVAVNSVQSHPWVESMRWNLSGSHSRPDICNRYAEGGPKSDGLYPKASVPAKPHPQCFCYVTAELPDEDEFLDSLVGGAYDGFLKPFSNLKPGEVFSTRGGAISRTILEGRAAPVAKAAKAAVPKLPAVAPVTPPASTSTRLPNLSGKVLIPGDNGAKILSELRNQQTLAPRSAETLKSVSLASHADRVAVGDPDGIAWYRIDTREIKLDPSIFGPKYSETWVSEKATNWCSKTGQGHSAGQATFAHEFGHHVVNMMRRASFSERSHFWSEVAKGLGTKPPLGIHAEDLAVWAKKNAAKIRTNVSKYGATSYDEFLAEVWQEYSTSGANARPFIRMVGDLLRELGEKGAR